MDPRKEGVRQGFADGSCQTKLETAKLMCARNYPIAEICEMTGLPIESFPKKTVLILLIDNSVGTGVAVGNALAGTFMSFYTPIYWLCITGIGNALIILLMFLVRKYAKD